MREKVIRMAVEAGRISAERFARDAFKATERRLYAVPDLRAKLKDDQEELEDIQLFISEGNSFQQEDIRAVIIDLEAAIAATSHELEALDKALASIRDDLYYLAVYGKYIQRISDEEIAKKIFELFEWDIPCHPTTIWKNRKRLVQRVAVRLYGADAVK